MANTKIIAYGFNTTSGLYFPLQVDTAGFLNVHITAVDPSAQFDVIGDGANNADAVAPISNSLVRGENFLFLYNGASWDRARGQNISKTLSATATGDNTVWTPTSGKKFRLMGYTISVAGTLASLGPLTLQIKDGATVVYNHIVAVAATLAGDSQISASLGQGYLSTAANNTLRLNLGGTLLTGAATINAWGTEE